MTDKHERWWIRKIAWWCGVVGVGCRVCVAWRPGGAIAYSVALPRRSCGARREHFASQTPFAIRNAKHRTRTRPADGANDPQRRQRDHHARCVDREAFKSIQKTVSTTTSNFDSRSPPLCTLHILTNVSFVFPVFASFHYWSVAESESLCACDFIAPAARQLRACECLLQLGVEGLRAPSAHGE